ncbi:YceI family protein [Povalibacter sp.]|uniref:YceI family protein n=1 Tax=Povalibacter sp. TaxID=1962978 RepID=UPI002F3EEF8E
MKFPRAPRHATNAIAAIALFSPWLVGATTTDQAMTKDSPSVDASSTTYVVSEQKSSVNILVYRAGALALFGHDHVMTVGALSGKVRVGPAQSGFDLSFPVAGLIIDDAAARKAAGRDFASEVPQADRDGTRHNMLLPEVLDGEHYPQITLRSAQMSGTLPDAQFVVHVQIKDVTRDIRVPATVTIDGKELTAKGQFDILQSDFGIKPFKVALGALEVRDRLVVNFRISAQAQ